MPSRARRGSDAVAVAAAWRQLDVHAPPPSVYWVYIAASRSGVLYVGVTTDLERRMGEHQAGDPRGFTGRYRCNRLLFAQGFDSVLDAIAGEKKLKGWTRARKVALINEHNPEWTDLTGRFDASSYHRERKRRSF